jgi:hypothetical protein
MLATAVSPDFTATIEWGGGQNDPRNGLGRRGLVHGLQRPHLRRAGEEQRDRYSLRRCARNGDSEWDEHGDRHAAFECPGARRSRADLSGTGPRRDRRVLAAAAVVFSAMKAGSSGRVPDRAFEETRHLRPAGSS